ncbi:MAG: class I SAM-dependent methyltransferase [Sulfuricaulis sp.]
MQKKKVASFNISAMADDGLNAEISPSTGRVSVLDRWVARKLLDLFDQPPLTFVLWNGEEISPSGAAPSIRVRMQDSEVLHQLLMNPALHFGNLYSAERIDIEGDLIDFLKIAYHATESAPKYQKLKNAHTRFFYRPHRNRPEDSRDNIHHHYDIGNEFYERWLDREAMQYTCAYFPSPDLTLEQAQRAKMDHVCRKLQLKPGDRVVEAGCGWGGLARHMARHYGAKVSAYNISHEQILYAREKAKADGLDKSIEYVEDDYRNISGEYDAFVSVGMLEHVGLSHYRELGEIIDRCLSPNGFGLIHSIGRNKPEPINAWIEKNIFPGSYPPTLREMMGIFETRQFSVLDVENLRLHYAKTLEHWLARFDRDENVIEKMFDRAFVRSWRLYLAGSLASFATGTLQLFQVVFSRGTNNDLPWSREHIYR